MRILYLGKLENFRNYENYKAEDIPSMFFGYYGLAEIGASIDWYSHKRSSQIYKFFKQFYAGIDSYYLQLACINKANKYDIIYMGEDIHIIILAILRMLHIIRKPIFAVSHFTYNTQYTNSRKKKWFIKVERYLVYKYIDKISFASEKLLEIALKDYNIPKRHRNTCYWGANMKFFDIDKYKGIEKKEDYFLASGGTNRDYPTLIKAFKIRPELHLILNAKYKSIDGNTPDNIYIEKKIDFSIEDFIRQRTQTYNCIAVLIPIKEINQVPNGATVMVEALAMGKPIIITRLDTNLIDVEKEGIGLTVSPGDVNGWIQAISWMVTHPEERRIMGEKAFLLAKKKYNVDIFSKKIYYQMQELAKNK